MKTILSRANVIDCVEPKVLPDTAVLIENGRIRAILPSGEAGSVGDAQTIDLKGAYLMPGLWDVHIHPDYLSLDEMPLADQVTLFGHRLATALTEAGITGMRCAGTHHFMDVAWKRAFDSGQHVGPRLFASGHFLTTTGGHFLTSGHALEVDGPYGWVKAIREQIKNGVDHIKLNLSGGIMGPAWDLHTHSFLLDDELRAAFEICRKRGFKVMAHATNPDAVKNAIRLGAHSIEHGYMGLWVRDGATPWQTLLAATRHGAAVCGVGAELGTVEVGKLADLIVVAANPLEDITNVRRLHLVLKEGRVVSDKRHPHGAAP